MSSEHPLSNKEQAPGASDKTMKTDRKPADPEWADGLRQLYDRVVDEELPDSLRDLLSKLDEGK